VIQSAASTFRPDRNLNPYVHMLSWTITFLVIALIAGILGFTGIAGTAASIAQILFFIFLALMLISLLTGVFRRRG